MKQELVNIGIQEFLKLSFLVDESNIGQDFIIGEANGSAAFRDSRLLEALHYPVRYDGYILFFVKKGHFVVNCNLNSFDVEEHSLLVTVPGNIVQLPFLDEERLGETEIAYVVMSKEFISGLHLDFNRAFQESVRMLETPCILLNDEQVAIAESYFRLAKQILGSSQRQKKQIITSLLSSLSYLADDVWTEQLRVISEKTGETTSRVNQVYHQFMKLVAQYHSEQRNMAFYADKLFLTPKYLSKLVKEASGRSGPQWIDAYVILEAKNLLRYSDDSFKEIVYKLNFQSASVFNKFFKLHTGMSPSEYRKGI